MIKVEYDGNYPCTCMGTLKITVDNAIVYEEKYCCTSTGNVWFDDDCQEHVECGELVWNDADKFNEEIRKAVKDKLSECDVCCGGCV